MTLNQKPVTFKYTDNKNTFLTTAKTDAGVLVYDFPTGETPANITLEGQKHGVLAVNGTVIGGGLVGVKHTDDLVKLSIFEGATTSNLEVYSKAGIDNKFKVADFTVKATPNTGYLKSYEFTMADGTKNYIDIPKDFLLKDAHVCSFQKVGDKYVDSVTSEEVTEQFLTEHNITAGNPTFHFVINVNGDDNVETKKDLYVSLNSIMPDAYSAGKGLGYRLTDEGENQFYVENTYTFAATKVYEKDGQSTFGVAVTEYNDTTKESKVVGYLRSSDDLTADLLTRLNVNDLSTRLNTTNVTVVDVSSRLSKLNLDFVNASTRLGVAEKSIVDLSTYVHDTIGDTTDNITDLLGDVSNRLKTETDAIKKDITDVSARVKTNTDVIADVSAKYKAADTALDTKITDVSTRVKTNTDNITKANTNIADVSARVKTNTDNITKANTDIADVSTRVKTNADNITKANTNIADVSARVKTNADNITKANTNIADVSARVKNNKDAIDVIDASVENHETILGQINNLLTFVKI